MDATLLKLLKIEFREFCVNELIVRNIEDIFNAAGFTQAEPEIQTSGARRSLVESYYASKDWNEPYAIDKFIEVLEFTLRISFLSDASKDNLRHICMNAGLSIDEKGYNISYGSTQSVADKFMKQFPFGLPFGVPKPDFTIKAKHEAQEYKFELKDGMGIIKSDVYPTFSFKQLEKSIGINSSTNLTLKKSLVLMNQTDYEKEFFIAYAKKFDMANKDVPVLIPQAWIQWHSQHRKNLREKLSRHSDELYRVDFVAFWNNERYVVLIDDISHYSKKIGTDWHADEEAYSKRLKEDRSLQKEKWKVFRVSNWEIKDAKKVSSILDDLKEFIGFN
jgi:hypothetical protein